MKPLITYLIGSLCVLCDCHLSGRDARLQLCQHCLASLPWHPTGSAGPIEDVERIVSPLRYSGAAARWVLKSKHHGGLVEARVLGGLLAAALREAYPEPPDRPAVIVPVPLSRQRLMHRGHNQAALIAQPVARSLGIRMAKLAVTRIRHTPIQPGLEPDQRRRNLRGVFRTRRSFTGEPVAIVDDVLTTGATVAELAGCLKRAGAGDIHVWCATQASDA